MNHVCFCVLQCVDLPTEPSRKRKIIDIDSVNVFSKRIPQGLGRIPNSHTTNARRRGTALRSSDRHLWNACGQPHGAVCTYCTREKTFCFVLFCICSSTATGLGASSHCATGVYRTVGWCGLSHLMSATLSVQVDPSFVSENSSRISSVISDVSMVECFLCCLRICAIKASCECVYLRCNEKT